MRFWPLRGFNKQITSRLLWCLPAVLNGLIWLVCLFGQEMEIIHLIFFSELTGLCFFHYYLLSDKCHINYGENFCLMESCLVFNRECSIRCGSDCWSVETVFSLGCNQRTAHTHTVSCTHTNTAYNGVYQHTENTHHCKSNFVTACCWNIFSVECQWAPILCEYSCTVSKENSVHSAPSPAELWKC